VVDLNSALAEALDEAGANATGIVDHSFMDSRRVVAEKALLIPAAIVVDNQDHVLGASKIDHEFHPAPADPCKLRQELEQRQELRPAGHCNQGIVVELKRGPEKILEVRLEARVAAMKDYRRAFGRWTDFGAPVVLRRTALAAH